MESSGSAQCNTRSILDQSWQKERRRVSKESYSFEPQEYLSRFASTCGLPECAMLARQWAPPESCRCQGSSDCRWKTRQAKTMHSICNFFNGRSFRLFQRCLRDPKCRVGLVASHHTRARQDLWHLQTVSLKLCLTSAFQWDEGRRSNARCLAQGPRVLVAVLMRSGQSIGSNSLGPPGT